MFRFGERRIEQEYYDQVNDEESEGDEGAEEEFSEVPIAAEWVEWEVTQTTKYARTLTSSCQLAEGTEDAWPCSGLSGISCVFFKDVEHDHARSLVLDRQGPVGARHLLTATAGWLVGFRILEIRRNIGIYDLISYVLLPPYFLNNLS